MTCRLSDDDADDQDGHLVVHGSLSISHGVGQLLIFLVYSFNPSSSTVVCLLLGLLPLAVFGYLAVEIRLRLAGETSWRSRRRYVALRIDEGGTTWLPRYDPLESPRQDCVRPLFDDRPTYVTESHPHSSIRHQSDHP